MIGIIIMTYLLCGLYTTYVYSKQSELEERLFGKWRWWEYTIFTLGWIVILIIAGVAYIIVKKNDKSI